MQATLPIVIVEPVSIPMLDELVHTLNHPFCDDSTCPCHGDDSAFRMLVEQPVLDGLMTTYEGAALFWRENI